MKSVAHRLCFASLRQGNKLHARGRRDLEDLAGGSETSGLPIDAKHHDVARFLVGRQQPGAGRIDSKITRCFPIYRDEFNVGQRPGCGSDRKNGDAVVPSIRSVKKLAGRVERDFSRFAVTSKSIRTRRDRAQFPQPSIRRVVSIGRHRRLHFIDHVQQLSIPAKHEMAWTRTGIGLRCIRGRSQGSIRGVERISQHLIEPEISDQSETIVGRPRNRVGMRPLLPFFVHARTPVLDEGRGLAQSAVL